jgi:hypothetical protein
VRGGAAGPASYRRGGGHRWGKGGAGGCAGKGLRRAGGRRRAHLGRDVGRGRDAFVLGLAARQRAAPRGVADEPGDVLLKHRLPGQGAGRARARGEVRGGRPAAGRSPGSGGGGVGVGAQAPADRARTLRRPARGPAAAAAARPGQAHHSVAPAVGPPSMAWYSKKARSFSVMYLRGARGCGSEP